MNKISYILLNSIPTLIMIGLIPLIKNDYLLLMIDIVIIIVALVIRKEHKDLLLLLVGILVMIISESIFVSTRVETFNRQTLLGLMPIWLPVLWGYAFIAIKRGVLKLTT